MPANPADESIYPGYFGCRVAKDGSVDAFSASAERKRVEDWIHRDKESQSHDDGKSKRVADKAEDGTTGQKVEQGFQPTLTRFTTSIRSFYDLIVINATVRNAIPRMFTERELNEYRKESLPVIAADGQYVLHGVSAIHVPHLNRRIKRYEHLREGIAALPASILMGLVARFDAGISELVRFLLQNRKERLAGTDRTILVRDVLASPSFDDLIASLIDDEIHGLMRGSHEDQIKYIEDNFSIKVRDGFTRWPQLIELFERRNLAAHGEGFANARYARICMNAQVPKSDMLELGAPLKLNESYLRNAIDLMLEFGILLIWWLWLKQAASEVEQAYTSISNVTYDLIVEKRYKLASRILISALSRKSESAPEIIRRMMAINLANCYKKIKDEEGFEKALKLFDWSASADNYKISIASLREDVDAVCSLMPKVTDEDVVGKTGFRDWPVFDWVRDNSDVKASFERTFGEPLELASEVQQVSPEVNTEKSDSVTVEQSAPLDSVH
jgi:hypothetical protein